MERRTEGGQAVKRLVFSVLGHLCGLKYREIFAVSLIAMTAAVRTGEEEPESHMRK